MTKSKIVPKTVSKTKRKNKRSAIFNGKQSDRNGPFALEQIQYRSYQQEIQIYHFRTRLMSVATFRSFLKRDANLHGYVATMISSEKPLFDLYVPDGDEVPDDYFEVAYLPRVFPRRGTPGCALGFRSGGSVIEWLIFTQPVDIILSSWMGKEAHPNEVLVKLGAHQDDPYKLFNLVALMPKGQEERRVRGSNAEHKKWHDSLWNAKLHPVTLKMTWKNFGTGLKVQIERPQAEIEAELAEEEEADADEDHDDNDNEHTGNIEEYNDSDDDECETDEDD
jgi:hypothetical protein